MTYDLGNPDPGLGQPQICGGVNSLNRWIYIYKQTIENNAHISVDFRATKDA